MRVESVEKKRKEHGSLFQRTKLQFGVLCNASNKTIVAYMLFAGRIVKPLRLKNFLSTTEKLVDKICSKQQGNIKRRLKLKRGNMLTSISGRDHHHFAVIILNFVCFYRYRCTRQQGKNCGQQFVSGSIRFASFNVFTNTLLSRFFFHDCQGGESVFKYNM